MKIKITEGEITDVLFQLKNIVDPQSIKLAELTRIVFGRVDDILERKVRLCIKELRGRGYLIIAKRGYSFAGIDPEPAIHFVNGLYSRAHSLTKDADIMYHEIKKKYGDAVALKVEQLPGQPMLDVLDTPIHNPAYRLIGEPAFRKSYTREGIENQFQADA